MPACVQTFINSEKLIHQTVQNEIVLFGESIEWLAQAGIVLKCQKIDHGTSPIVVYSDLSSFKLYMSDVGLFFMKSGVLQQTILTGESNVFMGSVQKITLLRHWLLMGAPSSIGQVNTAPNLISYCKKIPMSLA